jgi:pimeloyl-ACP methyl ester carboxylesterase
MKNYPIESKLKNSNSSQTTQKKETVVMLHGTASNAYQWSLLAEQLATHFLVLSPEIPGYEREPIKTNRDMNSLENRIRPLLHLIDSTAGKMHLVGHSFGGLVAMRLGELRPNKILSISIYEPTAIGVFKNCLEPSDLMLVAEVKQLAEIVANSSPDVAMESFINFWHGGSHWSTIARDIQKKLSKYSSIAAQDFINGLEDLYQPQQRPFFKGKMHVLFGTDTVPLAKRIAAKLIEQLPNATLYKLNGLGHMGPITNPELFNAAIVSILGISSNKPAVEHTT